MLCIDLLFRYDPGTQRELRLLRGRATLRPSLHWPRKTPATSSRTCESTIPLVPLVPLIWTGHGRGPRPGRGTNHRAWRPTWPCYAKDCLVRAAARPRFGWTRRASDYAWDRKTSLERSKHLPKYLKNRKHVQKPG